MKTIAIAVSLALATATAFAQTENLLLYCRGTY